MQHRGMEAVCRRLAVLMQNALHLLVAGSGIRAQEGVEAGGSRVILERHMEGTGVLAALIADPSAPPRHSSLRL